MGRGKEGSKGVLNLAQTSRTKNFPQELEGVFPQEGVEKTKDILEIEVQSSSVDILQTLQWAGLI